MNRNNKATYIPIILGDYYNAYGMVRSFGDNGIKPILVTKSKKSFMRHSKYLEKNFVISDVNVDEEQFIQELILIGKNIMPIKGVLYPTHDEELLCIAKNKHRLAEYFEFPFSDYSALVNIMDKSMLNKVCSDLGIPTIKESLVSSKNEALECAKLMRFPLILKVVIWDEKVIAALGGKIKIVDSYNNYAKEIEKFFESYNNGRLLVQEYIEDSNKLMPTVNTVSDREGNMECVFTSLKVRQEPPKTGTSTAEIVVDPREKEYADIIEYTKRIIKYFSLYGLSGTEYKYDPRDDKYKVIEMNCRSEFPNYLQVIAGQEMALYLYKKHIGEEANIPFYPTRKNASCYVPIRDKILNVYIHHKDSSGMGISLKEWKKSIVKPTTLYGITYNDFRVFIGACAKEWFVIVKVLIRMMLKVPQDEPIFNYLKNIRK